MIRHIKRGLALFAFLFLSSSVQAQTFVHRIDSLRKVTMQKGLSDTLLIQAYVSLSREMVKVKDAQSLQILNKLKELGQKLNSQYVLGHYNLQSASFYYLNQNLNTALRFAEKAIVIFKKDNNKTDLIDAYNIEGLIYQSYQTWARSLMSYQKALTLCKKLNDTARYYTVTSNIALIYQYNKDYLKALAYYNKSEKYYSKIKNSNTLAVLTSNMATCYKELKKFELAEKYYLRAISIIQK
ncbi:MAG: tetratricopeptide repeat protein [Microscillaceae bacterium]|nr:tetratricopeptide repeat protein [Microscillaceae bacterium]